MVSYELIADALYVGVFITGVSVLNHHLIERSKYLNSLPLDERLAKENGLERVLRRVAEWGSD